MNNYYNQSVPEIFYYIGVQQSKDKMIDLKGIMPPVPTTFHADESFYPEKMKENILALLEYEMLGVVVLGSNGEKVMLSDREKRSVIENARKVVPESKHLIAGAGGESTRETIHDIKEAARCGADAAMVLTPFYYKNRMTRDALVLHFNKVADASPVPVLTYNMPGFTGLDMDAETVIEIADHPNIAGIKDSGGDMHKMAEILDAVKNDIHYLAGGASFILPALSGGASGGILALSNVAPALCLELYHAFRTGNLARAKELQQKAVPISDAFTRRGGIPALKATIDHAGMYGGPVRSPLLPLSSGEREEFVKLLDDLLV